MISETVIQAAPVAAAAASNTAQVAVVVLAAGGVTWCWYNRGRDWPTALIFTVLGMLIQDMGFEQFFATLTNAGTGAFNVLTSLGG
ncbi:hypothetical protein [Actinomadura yumaensis]|uniref:Uncharacterized protein n=1 Tax=Actinomadura yumaensis TaxID=111807 RepID=A0ABW2CNN4_9ACTN